MLLYSLKHSRTGQKDRDIEKYPNSVKWPAMIFVLVQNSMICNG